MRADMVHVVEVHAREGILCLHCSNERDSQRGGEFGRVVSMAGFQINGESTNASCFVRWLRMEKPAYNTISIGILVT